MTKETKELIKQDPNANLPAAHDYGEDVGDGFDNQDSSFIALPFLNVVQSNSKAVGDDAIQARPGQFHNSVTNQLYDGKTGVEFVCGWVDRKFVEWVPLKEGGGFVAQHEPDSEVVDLAKKAVNGKVGKLKMPDGKNDLVETFYMYGYIVDDQLNPETPAVISITSTKIKPFRAWSTLIKTLAPAKFGIKGTPPLYAHRIRIKTVKESAPEGDYFNVVLEPAVPDANKQRSVFLSLLPPDSAAYQQARVIRGMVETGEAKVDHSQQDAGRGGVGDGNAGVQGGTAEVPF